MTSDTPTPETEIWRRLKSSAAAFRDNAVYTADGDPIRLSVQAAEMDEAASALARQAQEIDRLRAERDEAIHLMSQYARDLGEMEGRYKAAHWPGIVDEWKARAEAAEAETAKLREKRDETLPAIQALRAKLGGDG